MNILLFGVSNVGKTCTGKVLADRLGFEFYDLDEEVKKHFSMSLEKFVKTGTLRERDIKRDDVICKIMGYSGDKVFAISPVSYLVNLNQFISRSDVLAIELQDSPANIFDRLVFSDENDVIYKDDEYKYEHAAHYLKEIKADIAYYKKTFAKVKNKFFIDNDPIEVVVDRIIEDYFLSEL
jgi:adenylate kinase family enzyme